MIRLSHYPPYLIKIYCTEQNILLSIIWQGHRGHAVLFTEVSTGKMSLCVMLIFVYWSVQAQGAALWHDPLSSPMRMAQCILFHYCLRQPSNSITVALQSSK